MSTRNIYALMVGIDKYEPPVPALDGCVNDMRAMKTYLERRTNQKGWNLQMEVLENDQATRQNIVNKFENHLTKARENDIAFFYFSGHGSQEHAHEVFWHLEEDKKNETIVCYDSRMPDGMDLADKEIATLLDMVAAHNPHIVVVMDCCNSGSGTRGTSKVRNMSDPPAKLRSLDSYILPRNLNSDRSALNMSNVETNLIIPLARHVALSAAQSFQLAKETYLGGSPRGVFTYSLIETLENAVGPLTYSDLMRRVRGLVTQRTYEQTPQLYALELDDVDLDFLDGSTSRKVNYYELKYVEEEDRWEIDAGAVHGILAGNFEGSQTVLWAYPEDAPEDELEDPSKALGTVSVVTVASDKSVVQLDGDLWLDNKTAYRARIKSMPIRPMKVCLRGDNEHGVNSAIAALGQDEEAKFYLQKVDTSQEADYNLLATDKQEYIITRKSDADDQPLVEQINGFTPETAAKAIDYLVHIAKWEQIKELTNLGSNIPSEAVRIDVMHPTNNTEVIPAGPTGNVFAYEERNGSAGYPRFRIKLTNNHHERLYVSLLYMSSLFEIHPGMLPQGGVWLEPGAEVWARNAKAFTGKVADELIAFGKNEVRETFKLMMGTTEFNAKLLRMQSLKLPKPQHRALGKPGNTRSLLMDDGPSGAFDDWNTSELAITLRRDDA